MSDDNVVDFEKYRVSVGRGTAPEISALDLQRYREWMQSRAMKKYMLYERQKPTFCEFLIADDLTCRVLLGDTSQARARFNVQIQKGKAALRRARPFPVGEVGMPIAVAAPAGGALRASREALSARRPWSTQDDRASTSDVRLR